MDPEQVDSGEVIFTRLNGDLQKRDDVNDGQLSTAETRSEAGSPDEQFQGSQDKVQSQMFKDVTSALRDVVLELHSLKQEMRNTHCKETEQASDRRVSLGNQESSSADFNRNSQFVSGQPLNPGAQPFTAGEPTCNPSYRYVRPEGHTSMARPDRCNYNNQSRSQIPRGHHQTAQIARSYNNFNYTQETPARFPPVKLPTFSGKEDWVTWLRQFEVIATRFGWNEEEMLDQLLPRLEEQAAQFVFSQLRPDIINSYRDLTDELSSRFQPIETPRSYASKFARRMQRNGEMLEEYAADLKRLYDKAHAYRDKRTRQEDLVRKFLDGLQDDDMRFELEFSKEPNTIDEAVLYAVNWVQLKGRNRRKRHEVRRLYEDSDQESDYDDDDGSLRQVRDQQKGDIKIEDQPAEIINNMLKEVMTRLDRLEEHKNRARAVHRKTVVCYCCHKQGHYARECPDRSTYANRSENNTGTLNGQGPNRST